MKYVLWICGIAVMCLFGGIIYRARKKNEPENPVTRQQQLLEQLRKQREDISRAQYRQDCAVLFKDLSGGIQDMFAQEKRPYSKEKVFCRRLVIIAENESLQEKIAFRKILQTPEPISSETEEADEETLEEIIRIEKAQCFTPVLDISWDVLMDSMLPYLQSIMQAAQDEQAEDCRRLLLELKDLLASYHIYPVWYHEEVVQENSNMQWDYVEESKYAIPTLYYFSGDEYIHVGVAGGTGTD